MINVELRCNRKENRMSNCWNCGESIHYHSNGLPHNHCVCGAYEPNRKQPSEPEQQQVKVRCNHKFEFNMSGEAQCIYCLSFEQPEPTPSESERERIVAMIRKRVANSEKYGVIIIDDLGLSNDIIGLLKEKEKAHKDLAENNLYEFKRANRLQNELSQAKAENEKLKDGFHKGYLCACATYVRSHGQSTPIEDVFKCNFLTEQQMIEKGIDDSDIEALKPLIHQSLNNK